MKKNHLRSQSGMIPFWEIIAILLAILAILAAYFAYQTNQKKATKASPSPTVSASASPAVKYFSIPELGVRFKNPSVYLADLHYSYKVLPEGLPTAYLGTDALAAAPANKNSASCGIADGPIGAISKYKPGDDFMGAPVEQSSAKKLGNFYYVYEESQSYCSDGDANDTAVHALQTKLKAAWVQEMGSLELIP